jgi:hypothetical protein
VNVRQRVGLDLVGVEDLLDAFESDQGFGHWGARLQVGNGSYQLSAISYQMSNGRTVVTSWKESPNAYPIADS